MGTESRNNLQSDNFRRRSALWLLEWELGPFVCGFSWHFVRSELLLTFIPVTQNPWGTLVGPLCANREKGSEVRKIMWSSV